MKVTAQQFVSNSPTEDSFVTVFKHYSQESQKTSEKEGEVYCLFSLSGEAHLPAERVSKFVWDGILDGYLYSSSRSTNDSLKDAITDGVKKLKSLIKNDKTLEELGVDLNFVLVAQRKEGVYIGNLGENEIYVFKDGSLVNISEILGKSRASTAGIALKSNDILVAATKGVISKNTARFSNVKSAPEVFDLLKMIGSEITGDGGLLFFSSPKSASYESSKPKILPDLLEEKIEQVVPKISKVSIKKPDINFEKVRVVVKKGISKIPPILKAVSEKIGKVLHRLKEKVFIRYENKRWFKKVASKVSEIKVNAQPYSSKGMRIDGYRIKNKQNKRFTILVLVVLGVVLLAVGINFTVKAKKSNEIHTQAIAILNDAQTLVKKAEDNATADKSGTETTIYQAQTLLKGLPQGISSKDTSTLDDLNERILKVQDFLYKRTALVDNDGKLSSFVDTKLLFGENSNPTDIDIYKDSSQNEYLVVTDSGLNAVFRIALYDKSLTTIPDPSGLVKSPKFVSMGNGGIFIYDDKSGVLRVPFGEGSTLGNLVALSGLSRSDISAKDIAELIVLTADDNVYLLARDQNSLLKSVNASENGYGLSYKYITDEKFGKASDIASDISLYIATSDDPQVVRYSYSYTEGGQVENPLTLTGVDGSLGGITKEYTGDSLDFSLYLFDAANKRFLKFEKPQESENLHPGQAILKNQVVYRGSNSNMWSNVKDFVIDSSEKTMYILDGTTIWKVVI